MVSACASSCLLAHPPAVAKEHPVGISVALCCRRKPGLSREMRIVDYSWVDGRYDKRAFLSTVPNLQHGSEESHDRFGYASDRAGQDFRSMLQYGSASDGLLSEVLG